MTKTTGGMGAIEDKPVTLTIASVDASGQAGPAQTITFAGGKGGSQTIPGLCTGSPVTIAVAVKSAGGGGLGGLLGGGSQAIATGQGSSSSQITFDPSTCILSQALSGNKGDTLNFTCPNNPVNVVSVK